MKLKRNGRHTAPNEKGSRGRKASAPLVILLALAMLGAGAAVAAYLSREISSTDTMTAEAVGNVDIGDAATEGLLSSVFGYEPASWVPGTTADGCFIVGVDGTGATNLGDFRAYASSIGGTGLADYLNVEIRVDTSGAGVPTGHIDPQTCIDPVGAGASFTWEPGDTKYTGTLSALPATYPAGLVLGAPAVGVQSKYLVWIHLELPDTQAVNDNTQGLDATMAAAFENQ